jgi:hypothetical protein
MTPSLARRIEHIDLNRGGIYCIYSAKNWIRHTYFVFQRSNPEDMRIVDIPAQSGRVLYCRLSGKDQIAVYVKTDVVMKIRYAITDH